MKTTLSNQPKAVQKVRMQAGTYNLSVHWKQKFWWHCWGNFTKTTI